MIEAPSRAVSHVLTRGAARVTQINATTRDEIQGIIATAVANDIPLAQLADALERGADLQPLIGRSGGVVGDLRYRSEMIARTEMMQAYNAATLASYGEAGIEHVIAIDGDGDEECAARNGQSFTRDEADTIEDHPNGTLDWVPDFDSMKVGTQPEPDFTSGEVAVAAEEPAALPVVAAPVPPAMQPPVAKSLRDIISPVTKPVSAAFDNVIAKVEAHPLALKDPQYVKAVAKIKGALKTIGETARDGNLPEMPMIGPLKGGQAGVQGMYSHEQLGMRLPRALEFRSNAHWETVFHEMSHFIDHHGIGFEGEFASKMGWAQAKGQLQSLLNIVERRRTQELAYAGVQRAAELNAKYDTIIAGIRARADLMEPVARAIMDSQGYRALMEPLGTGVVAIPTETTAGSVVMGTTSLSSSTQKWILYATDAREAFARAMGQYFSRRMGGEAVTQIEDRLYAKAVGGKTFLLDANGQRILAPLADQWTDADFAPIDRAITTMLRTLGWLVE